MNKNEVRGKSVVPKSRDGLDIVEGVVHTRDYIEKRTEKNRVSHPDIKEKIGTY